MDVKPGLVLAVFDLDGTVSRRDTFVPFVFGFLWRHPWRMPRLLLFVPSLLAYVLGFGNRGALKGALLHAAMGGVKREEVDRWSTVHAQRVVDKGLHKEALAAIQSHLKNRHYLVLMSASIDCYVQRISVALGFHETICTTVVWNRKDNTLEGHLQGSNIRGDKKAQQFKQLVSRLHPRESTAYGNSQADVEHMLLATRGVFVNGKPKLPSSDRRIRVVNWR
jgi:HAD superfamily phosphoserine phosphatase-like hydrolase